MAFNFLDRFRRAPEEKETEPENLDDVLQWRQQFTNAIALTSDPNTSNKDLEKLRKATYRHVRRIEESLSAYPDFLAKERASVQESLNELWRICKEEFRSRVSETHFDEAKDMELRLRSIATFGSHFDMLDQLPGHEHYQATGRRAAVKTILSEIEKRKGGASNEVN